MAPLLIIHGANDPRVPVGEAELIYEKLMGRFKDDPSRQPVKLIYGDEGHGLAKLENQIDAYGKTAEFLNRVVIEPHANRSAT